MLFASRTRTSNRVDCVMRAETLLAYQVASAAGGMVRPARALQTLTTVCAATFKFVSFVASLVLAAARAASWVVERSNVATKPLYSCGSIEPAEARRLYSLAVGMPNPPRTDRGRRIRGPRILRSRHTRRHLSAVPS